MTTSLKPFTVVPHVSKCECGRLLFLSSPESKYGLCSSSGCRLQPINIDQRSILRHMLLTPGSYAWLTEVDKLPIAVPSRKSVFISNRGHNGLRRFWTFAISGHEGKLFYRPNSYTRIGQADFSTYQPSNPASVLARTIHLTKNFVHEYLPVPPELIAKYKAKTRKRKRKAKAKRTCCS